jgi:carboxymethylenebutenolidase
MPSISEHVTTPDGSCPVTLHTPDGPGPWHAVVMYPDAHGFRDTFQTMAARLAGFGYAVLLPDVYYRHGDWQPFDMSTVFGNPQERQRRSGLATSLTPDTSATDAGAFFDFLAERPEVKGDTFGVCGYCLGGQTSFIVAGRVPDRVAAVGAFHPSKVVTDDATSPHLLAERIKATVYVGGAQDDAQFTAENAKTLDESLTAAGVQHTIEMYSAAHGFAIPDVPPYSADAAKRHWTALRDLFGATLSE